MRTPRGVIVAASEHAVWIPAGERHGGMYTGQVVEQNLYVDARRCARLPARCCLVQVSARLAQAISSTVTSRVGYQAYGRAADEAVLLLPEEEVLDAAGLRSR